MLWPSKGINLCKQRHRFPGRRLFFRSGHDELTRDGDWVGDVETDLILLRRVLTAGERRRRKITRGLSSKKPFPAVSGHTCMDPLVPSWPPQPVELHFHGSARPVLERGKRGVSRRIRPAQIRRTQRRQLFVRPSVRDREKTSHTVQLVARRRSKSVI
jgi:hypothetical protein